MAQGETSQLLEFLSPQHPAHGIERVADPQQARAGCEQRLQLLQGQRTTEGIHRQPPHLAPGGLHRRLEQEIHRVEDDGLITGTQQVSAHLAHAGGRAIHCQHLIGAGGATPPLLAEAGAGLSKAR